MSSRPKEEEVRIPDVIFDNKTNKKYQKGSFLGKVTWIYNSVAFGTERAHDVFLKFFIRGESNRLLRMYSDLLVFIFI